MPDEFPTLEAVAALGVLALVIRTLVVANETKVLPPFAADLVRALRSGERSRALTACSAPDAPALARVARELISHVGEPPYGPEAALELRNEQSELEQNLARRAESGRARDLIVLAVLLGAMAFAALSRLPVSAWFQALAGAASLLLVVGYVMRSRLRREMLAAAEADLEFERAIVAEQGLRIERAGIGHAHLGQQFLDQRGLALAELVALAAAVKTTERDGIWHGAQRIVAPPRAGKSGAFRRRGGSRRSGHPSGGPGGCSGGRAVRRSACPGSGGARRRQRRAARLPRSGPARSR